MKKEQWTMSDVTPSIFSALSVWVIKILKAPLHSQYTHLFPPLSFSVYKIS